MTDATFTITFPSVPGGGGGGVTDHGALTGLSDDDHPQYQKESEKGQANGYASLNGSGQVPSAQLPAAGTGDMQSLVYDPGGVEANVYDAGNLIGNIDGGTFT